MSSVTELRAVKERAESERILHGKNMTFQQYSSLLQSACQQYDSAHRPTARRPPNRCVYTHKIHESCDDDDYDDNYNPDFDIDTPVDTISAFAAQFQDHVPGSWFMYAFSYLEQAR